jgi:hypothetical protein
MARALSNGGRAQHGRTRAPMAVLEPQRLGRRAAACLVEVDYLSNPEVERRLGRAETLDALAGDLSRGILDYLGRSSGSSALGYRLGDGFDDADPNDPNSPMAAYMRDERGSDSLQVSQPSDATALVDAYLGRGATTVWPNLDANAVAQQIKDRCGNARLFQQGNLNLCGPAAFLSIWAGRDPVGYAKYAIGLLESGAGPIGSTTINANATLEAIAYPRLGRPSVMTAPACDFLCMAPLRNDANAILPYDPSSHAENLEGLTTPGEVAGWLRATGVFSTVKDEGNWVRSAGIDHALNLMCGAGLDVAMLINVNALASAAQVQAISGGTTPNPVPPDNNFILSMFPDHFVVLLSEVTPDVKARTVTLSAWTWGGSYVFMDIPVATFSTNYYGAVSTILKR